MKVFIPSPRVKSRVEASLSIYNLFVETIPMRSNTIPPLQDGGGIGVLQTPGDAAALVQRTIDSYLCCPQLMRLEQEVDKKRPQSVNRKGVVFHHGDASPHISLATRLILREFGWEVLMHPPYSSDFAPSDFPCFGLFRIL
ncbi:Mariner Mos1 transposase [Eumeta japonica]|uniref:Mariner Mos1 transposase n=1 Tax=Eumeta variegata TaxID=151549 RepID=A0A4C1SUK0_EUMVA|nr:Mariner Mos1 transposase [Eumeta japonica]